MRLRGGPPSSKRNHAGGAVEKAEEEDAAAATAALPSPSPHDAAPAGEDAAAEGEAALDQSPEPTGPEEEPGPWEPHVEALLAARRRDQPALAKLLKRIAKWDEWDEAAAEDGAEQEEDSEVGAGLVADESKVSDSDRVALSSIPPAATEEGADPANAAWSAWADPWEATAGGDGEEDAAAPAEGGEGEGAAAAAAAAGGEGEAAEGGESEGGAAAPSPSSSSSRGGAVVATPDGASSDACLLFIHGGSFENNSAFDEEYKGFCSKLAALTGLTAVCPDHLLPGEGRPFQGAQILAQLVQDFLWLLWFDPVSQCPRPGAGRVVIAGDSSGATLAFSLLLILVRDHPDAAAAVLAMVLVSPCLDISCGSPTYLSKGFSYALHTGDVFFPGKVDKVRQDFRAIGVRYAGSEEALQDCIFSPYWLCRGRDEELLAALERASIPTWMCVGAAEALAGEVLDFAQRLQHRLPLEVWLHEGVFHCWIMEASMPNFHSRDAALRQLSDFLKRVLGPAEGSEESWPHPLPPRTSETVRRGIHYYVVPWEERPREAIPLA